MLKMDVGGNLYSEGLEKYPIGCVVGQNLFLLAYFGIGFAGMLPLQISEFPVISVLYALFLAVMLLFVLRKHLCTHCYYNGKRCSTGWGKLSALMFSSGNYRLGIKLAGVTWMLAKVIPVVGIIGALVLSYSFSTLIFLILFILLTPLNFVSHERACEKCRMRFVCPASMASNDGG